MHHYNSVLSLQITICNDTDGDHNNGATIQSWSGAWVWLIIMPVIVSCTDLFLYFLYLFSNFIQLVPILFTPVQLCTFLNFGEIFYMSSFTPILLYIVVWASELLFLLSLGLILHYNCSQSQCRLFSAHMVWCFFCKTVIYTLYMYSSPAN